MSNSSLPQTSSASTAHAPPAATAAARAQAAQILETLQAAMNSIGTAEEPSSISAVLASNLPVIIAIARDAKLEDSQMRQLQLLFKAIKDKNIPNLLGIGSATAPTVQASGVVRPQQPQPPQSPATPANSAHHSNGLKRKSPGADPAMSASPGLQPMPISANLALNNPGPLPWPNQQGSRPTLTGGLAAGRVAGTPALIARGPEDLSMFTSPDTVNAARQARKAGGGDQTMRRTIQDLVSSIDPNVKIEQEVEDLLLDIADEFIDSVTNFGCRLAKHRGGDTLEVRDLQLHLERNHNIRIPGFASDETRMSISQSAATGLGAGGAGAGRGGRGMTMTLRSARINAVQQAKRENKLM